MSIIIEKIKAAGEISFPTAFFCRSFYVDFYNPE